MKRMVLLFYCCARALSTMAQHDLGQWNSNYAGIQGSLLNPSYIAGSRMDWDVHVLSANIDFANDFLYAPKSAVPFLGFQRIIKGSIDEDLFLTRYNPQNPDKLYHVSFSGMFLGPSFFVKIKKKHEIGLTTALRGMANIRNITGNVGQNAFDYLLSGNLWNTNFQDQSARVNAMGWAEYGLHYATVLYENGNDELKGGVTFKILQGMFAAYAKHTNLTYRIIDTTAIAFTNSSIDYGRTDFDDFRRRTFHNFDHGAGRGLDIGFTWVHRDHAGDDNYRWRLGLSLLDAGSIRFDRNSGSYHLEAANAVFPNWHKAVFANNTQLDQTLSAVFYNGDSARSKTGTVFHMRLPTTLSVQADWAVCGPWFVNLTILQGFGHRDNVGVVQPDVYSLTPRYETRWFEVSLPLSLMYYGHWQPRAGIAVRAGYFFIGGDAVGGLLKLNDLQQADFYAGAHFFMPSKAKQPPLFNKF